MKTNHRLTMRFADENKYECLMLKILLGLSEIDLVYVNSAVDVLRTDQEDDLDN